MNAIYEENERRINELKQRQQDRFPWVVGSVLFFIILLGLIGKAIYETINGI